MFPKVPTEGKEGRDCVGGFQLLHPAQVCTSFHRIIHVHKTLLNIDFIGFQLKAETVLEDFSYHILLREEGRQARLDC